MRPNPKHKTPEAHQPCPSDNTSAFCHAQIEYWDRTEELVHPQVAMEIASWFQAPNSPGLTAFAGNGTYEDKEGNVLNEVWFELRRDVIARNEYDADAVNALRALEAYLIAIAVQQ